MNNRLDEQLVINYLAGDEKSFEVLIKRYLKPIYGFTFRFVGNSQDAEDVTQEIFLKVWRKLKKFNPQKGNFKTWIFVLAKNSCLDWLKKKKEIRFSDLKTGDGEFFIESIPDTHPLPDELFRRKDLANLLNGVLEKLSPKYKTLLLLRYNDHFTFKEISDVLGESINTVKSRHKMAIIALKKLLCDRLYC